MSEPEKYKRTILPTLNLRELRYLAISEAMAQANGNHKQAAKLLGVCDKTIQRRLDEPRGRIQPYSDRSTIA